MKSLKEQIEGKCRHFNGLLNDTCKAGVRYADVRDEKQAPFGYPCFREKGMTNCAKMDFLTPEEVQARIDAIHKSSINIQIARQAITEATEGKWGVSGSIPCPVCGTGTLGYSIASVNGHCHAACSTKGCVRWME